MRNIAETPTADYWDEVRELEAQICQREKELTPVVYPGVLAVDAWASDELEYDTTGYMTQEGATLFGAQRKQVTLTLFNLMDVGRKKQSIARLYELELAPGREHVEVFPIYHKLTRFGVARATLDEQAKLAKERNRARKLGGRRADFTAANETDYEFVREQLARGASGCYTRASK